MNRRKRNAIVNRHRHKIDAILKLHTRSSFQWQAFLNDLYAEAHREGYRLAEAELEAAAEVAHVSVELTRGERRTQLALPAHKRPVVDIRQTDTSCLTDEEQQAVDSVDHGNEIPWTLEEHDLQEASK